MYNITFTTLPTYRKLLRCSNRGLLYRHRFFGEALLFSDVIFCKIYFDAGYLFCDSCLRSFVLLHFKSIRSLSCCTFRESSLSHHFDHSAPLFRGFSISRNVVSAPCRLHDICNTILPSSCWLRSSPLCGLRGLVSCHIGVRKKTRLWSNFRHLLHVLRAVDNNSVLLLNG